MELSTSAMAELVRRHQGPFVAATEATRIPMIVTDARDPNNAVASVNDSFLALTGYAAVTILGETLSDFVHKLTDAESATTIHAAIEAGNGGTWEWLCRRADGSVFEASVFLSPVCDKRQIVCQNLLSFVPLGAHFDLLVKQHDQLTRLYEFTPGFIAIAEGPEHRFTFANASYKRFVDHDDLEGLTVAEAMPDIVTQGFVDILDTVYRTGEPFSGTGVAFDLKDRQTGLTVRRYADFVYQPVRNRSGEIVGLFCEGYDVTAQREAADTLALVQAELIHVSRINAMGTMAVTLAHELNQPLTAIANYTAGSLRLINAQANAAAAPIASALAAIDEASQRASDIIRTLRDLTRRQDTQHLSFNLRKAIGQCVRLVRAAAISDVVIIDLVPHDLLIVADRTQIQQVVINLLRNAYEAVAASQQKHVEINAVVSDVELIVSIADSGTGVSLEAAENIFAWSDSTKEGGMGLGLSICRTIIEAHRGRIWLEQSSEQGSTFCFALPHLAGDGAIPPT